MPSNESCEAGNGVRKYTVLVVDDHPVVREGLSLRINREADFTVCGTAGDGPEMMTAIARLNPEVLVMDLELPRSHGLELIRDIHAQYPRLPIIVFSTHDETVYAERAVRAGARGYLMKHEPPQRLLEGMRAVLNGGYALSRAVSDRLLAAFVDPPSALNESPIAGLGNRELEVFQFIGRGKGTKEIANLLNLSVKTIETYRERLKKKLNISSGPDLTRRAVLWVEANG
ncbi:MAG TPA: response regulator transcription factor [Verrucomicrobiae bacterium]|nr:response regulator transcription factor [Verrucomicrobiae bacterium]